MMTPQRYNDIEALAFDLLDDAQHDIEDKRDIYNALRDCLIALLPHITHSDPFSRMNCALPSFEDARERAAR